LEEKDDEFSEKFLVKLFVEIGLFLLELRYSVIEDMLLVLVVYLGGFSVDEEDS
jgi:hypothetical protein